MAQLRLFGPAAEAAGCRYDRLPGSTVQDVLNLARERYGPGFARVLARSRIWVNGDDPKPGLTIVDSDEVAVLPPVSGGAT